MDSLQVAALRHLFAGTPFDDEVVEFATALGHAPQPSGGLLVVGTPAHEPWHFVAHLADGAAAAGRSELEPTWVRWRPPETSAAHLATGTERLRDIGRHETVLVIADDHAPERLLDLLDDGHRRGAMVLALEQSNPDLAGIADEFLTVPDANPSPSFDLVQHVVTEIAPGRHMARPHIRQRLRHLLEVGHASHH